MVISTDLQDLEQRIREEMQETLGGWSGQRWSWFVGRAREWWRCCLVRRQGRRAVGGFGPPQKAIPSLSACLKDGTAETNFGLKASRQDLLHKHQQLMLEMQPLRLKQEVENKISSEACNRGKASPEDTQFLELTCTRTDQIQFNNLDDPLGERQVGFSVTAVQ